MWVDDRFCEACGDTPNRCKCTPAEKERAFKMRRFESLRAELATLERELGLPGSHGNRRERRAAASRGRR